MLNKKKLKIIAFDQNQHIILIMYTNARFRLTETTSDFGTKKINIRIVISLQ